MPETKTRPHKDKAYLIQTCETRLHTRRMKQQTQGEKQKRHEYYMRTKKQFQDTYYAMYRTYYAVSKDKIKDKRYQRVYGITLAEARLRLKQQGGRCAICGCHLKEYVKNHAEEWVLDHDHTMNYARGILCHACNRGLGAFNDYLKYLEQACLYLKTWSKKMPVKRVIVNEKPAYRWGTQGKAYTYVPGNKVSREAAKKKAIRQGLAAARSMGIKPEL